MKVENIKFKAKSILDGAWVQGDLVHKEDGAICILRNGFNVSEVDPTTVCQFTGLKDENGENIWEHDILESPFLKGEVIFFNGCFRVKKDDGSSLSFPTLSIINGKLRYFSVVGNKFDKEK